MSICMRKWILFFCLMFLTYVVYGQFDFRDIDSYPTLDVSTILLLVLGILAYGYWSRRRLVLPNSQGQVCLRPTLISLFGGVICIGLYFLIVVIAISGIISVALNTVLSSLFFFPLLISGIFNVTHFFRHRLIFDEEQLIIQDRKNKQKVLAWDEIIDVSRGFAFPILTPFYLSLRTTNYTYKIDPTLIGFKMFETYLDRYNPDIGLALKWRTYHNPNPGSGSL